MNIWFFTFVLAALGAVKGGVVGVLLGATAGFLMDKALSRALQKRFSPDAFTLRSAEAIQEVFFQATFRIMGRLAKADGRVSEREIAAASQIMSQMQLTESQRKLAIACFTEGKAADFDFSRDLNRLKVALRESVGLAQMFLEIQLTVAYADGALSLEERRIFDQLCRTLNISPFQFEWINSRVKALVMGAQYSKQERAQRTTSGSSSQQSWRSDSRHQSQQREQRSSVSGSDQQQLKHAYAVLGVSANVSDAELKTAYRRLMNEHHPDKLVAKGLPEAMMRLAKEKTQEIQIAYDCVRQARKAR
ncbi:MAG: co-chaperone DjlA [Bacterioplanes sp.]|nr:co-chaperone DjlA [Bacterioplanes sp.]